VKTDGIQWKTVVNLQQNKYFNSTAKEVSHQKCLELVPLVKQVLMQIDMRLDKQCVKRKINMGKVLNINRNLDSVKLEIKGVKN
jgi:hypothetical protein